MAAFTRAEESGARPQAQGHLIGAKKANAVNILRQA
ncbi:hypothetical protein ADICEAN_03311 [Cesiribacter andamanensis AMV16]|uniref:Uncharacterized protein n=1 Tax=Cesiribacter andamanensis AMV16 TaxID=1279009 RepID=M7NSV6_9BACT|nr:hypothetical protein ADICEAN_03311 [Cesiribacter andamanensis AMV16]